MLGAYITSMTFTVLGVSLHNKELIFHRNMTNTDNLTQVKNVKAYKESNTKVYGVNQNFILFKELQNMVLKTSSKRVK